MKLKQRMLPAFVAALMILIGMAHADAEPLKWRADLTVDYIEEDVRGISIGDQFVATFEVDPSLFEAPDDVQDGRFVDFNLTIGEVNWNESQPHTTPQFMLSPGSIDALSVTLTDTMPAHPDLSLFLPQSPATWEVKDENDPTGIPIFGGDFGGTYTVTPVSACEGNFDGDWDHDVDGLDLAGYVPSIADLAGFAAVFGSLDYCPRPEPECTSADHGWVVMKNDTPDQTHLYVWDMANALGNIESDVFMPGQFPPVAAGATLVAENESFLPGTYFIGDLNIGHYTILVTRRAVRTLDDGSTEDYFRIVYHNSDVNVVPCSDVSKLDLDMSTYLAYDMESTASPEYVPYEEFKQLLDNGNLTLTNSRIKAAQRAGERQRFENNYNFVQERLADTNPDFLRFLNQQIVDDETNTPSGDNWLHTITDVAGNTSTVITLGEQFQFSVVANTIRTKGTLENERAAYLSLYTALQESIPSDSWDEVRTELGFLSVAEAERATEVGVIDSAKLKMSSNWEWIKTFIIPGPEDRPLEKPDCTDEVGMPASIGLLSDATDQFLGHCAHHANGVFNNFFYPLKWFATCVKDQGNRATCPVFAITGGVEASWAAKRNEWVNLSEQYLYYKARNEWWPSIYGDGLSGDENAPLKMAPEVDLWNNKTYPFLYPYESGWVYNASNSRIDDDVHQTYSDSCVNYGYITMASPCSDTNHQGALVCDGQHIFCGYSTYKHGFSMLTNHGTAELWDFFSDPELNLLLAKMFLTCEVPLVIGLPVTPSFDKARNSGFIEFVFGPETNRGGHVVLVTGYINNGEITPDMDVSANDLATNGGGYFIIKNSWGGCWKDAGYIYIPYSWMKAHVYCMFTVSAEKKE